MGAGKTTVGIRLSSALNYGFIDLDREIEKKTGAEISWIFEKEGEAGFRLREKKLLNSLLAQNKVIISTGGGIILDSENRKILRNSTTVFFLKCQPKASYNRTRHDQKRPLLQSADPLKRLKEIYKKRESLYEATSHHTVDVNSISSKAALKKILKIITNGQS